MKWTEARAEEVRSAINNAETESALPHVIPLYRLSFQYARPISRPRPRSTRRDPYRWDLQSGTVHWDAPRRANQDAGRLGSVEPLREQLPRTRAASRSSRSGA